MKAFIKSLVLSTLLVSVGCTTSSPQKFAAQSDPFERYNRFMFGVNDKLDRAITAPIARKYVSVVPTGARKGVHNALTNLKEPFDMANLLLQGRVYDAHTSWCRFVVNSTLGVLGFWDRAAEWGTPAFGEDFGQTLAVWGVGNGPYIVVPLLGPFNARDLTGLIISDYSPLRISKDWDDLERYSLLGIGIIDMRAAVLGMEEMLYRQVDPYAFYKNLNAQNRIKKIFDNVELPPEEEEDLLEFLDE